MNPEVRSRIKGITILLLICILGILFCESLMFIRSLAGGRTQGPEPILPRNSTLDPVSVLPSLPASSSSR